MQALRIATRKSPLALWQAEHVAALLRTTHPGLEVRLVPIVTQGDRIQDRPLSAVGGKGLFIKELEVALLEHQADLAVHSMKDVPADLPEGFTIAAVLERADPRDAFLSHSAQRFADLAQGARLGTSSQRRQCVLKAARPDLSVQQLRGNVDTRLKKLDDGAYDAIILAAAGLTRLGLAARITEYLDTRLSLPAVGQGIVGIECRSEPRLLDLLAPLNHQPTRLCLDAERAFAARLEGSCQSPIGGFATLSGDALTIDGLVGAPDGSRIYRQSITGSARDGITLGRTLAGNILAAGADNLLASLRATAG
jgi:hydroxymethylbilane synthase